MRAVDELIARTADAVVDRLEKSDRLADAVASKLNGQLFGIRGELREVVDRLEKVEGRLGGVDDRLGGIEGRLGVVEVAVSEAARKVDDLHEWTRSLDQRVTELEEGR